MVDAGRLLVISASLITRRLASLRPGARAHDFFVLLLRQGAFLPPTTTALCPLNFMFPPRFSCASWLAPRARIAFGVSAWSFSREVGVSYPRSFDLLVWQAPHFFDLAELRKHPLVFFSNRLSLRRADKLDEVPMGTVKYDKGIWSVRPVPMLAVVMQLFGRWRCRAHLATRYVRGVVHDVRNARCSYVVILVWTHVSPEDRREHV